VVVELHQVAINADNTSADARRSTENDRNGDNIDFALNAFRSSIAQKFDIAPVVRSSNGIQSVLGGVGLDMIAAPRTQVAQKVDLDRTALDPCVRKINGLSDDAARLIYLILKAHERSSSRKPVDAAITEIAHAISITNRQNEVARNELSMWELIREALNGFGSREGWVPRLPR
jgi:hypothetical protein